MKQDETRSQYVIPTQEVRKDRLLAWMREAWQEGDAHLRSQRPYKDIAQAMRVIAGDEAEDIPPELSKVYTNRLKRQMREVVAVQSQINPTWYYQSLDPQFETQAQTMNRLLSGWWYEQSVDMSLRKANQYAVGLGTGWISPGWRKPKGRYGKGQIALDIYGPNDVRVVQPPRDHDIQKCYIATITVEMPVNLVKAMYPAAADKIMPDRDVASYAGESRAMRIIEKLGGALGGSYVLKKFGAKKPLDGKKGAFPTVDVHFSYVNDMRVNGSSQELFMGKPGTSWHYRVPYLGQELPTNIMSPATGQPATRRADFEDCLMYPMRRLVVYTNTWVLYDDTSPHWHGKVPLVKLVMDDWPWEFLGYGAIRDGHPIQKEINQTLRGIGDKIQNALRPGLAFDENIVSRGDMEKFDPRKPGARVQMNLQIGEGIKNILPEMFYRIFPEQLEYVQLLADALDHQMAVADMRQLAKARQIPSDSTIDKILEIAGPMVQDMTRVTEASIRDLGTMVGSMFIQHYDTARMVAMLGEDGTKLDFFNFKPEELWPQDQKVVLSSVLESYQKYERLREFTQNFQLMVAPNSLHEITQTQYKLMLFQLWRDPLFPLDPWTVAKAFKLQNFGPPPEGSMYDRWKIYMADTTQFQAVIQAMAQVRAALVAPQMIGQMAGAGGGGEEESQGGGGQPNGSPGGQNRPGRPPSGNAPPRLVQKDGGTRSTVAESR